VNIKGIYKLAEKMYRNIAKLLRLVFWNAHWQKKAHKCYVWEWWKLVYQRV